MSCDLCKRKTLLTRHHLIPKRTHRMDAVRSKFDKQERHSRIANLCKPCHRHVHRTFKERELAVQFNTIQSLMGHPKIQTFVDWIKDKPDDFHPRLSRRKNR